MIAGTAKLEITPSTNVWLDGLIREHESVGVHDPIFMRALVLANEPDFSDAFAVLSLDICVLDTEDVHRAVQVLADRTRIQTDRIILAASHNHSGPATFGFFNPKETEYTDDLIEKMTIVLRRAMDNSVPAAVGCRSGREETISRYRRFMDDNGKVVMLWEANPAESLMRVLGENDPEVGVLKVVDAEDHSKTICTLLNHAGHPNIMSGDNYLITADYPGVTQRLVEEAFGGNCMFTNGAQGNLDIDNWKYRDWNGMEHIGQTLAKAVSQTADGIVPSNSTVVRGSSVKYKIPSRKISDAELAWAEDILSKTGGKLQAVADGVGDDYKALLYRKLRERQDRPIQVSQICFAVGNTAFVTVPGELFTEAGMKIKAESPFEHTYILGLANGYIGYIPTREAIALGGYEVDTREADDGAEETIVEMSLALLKCVKAF
ncbi:MAG TPA: neutral/alkaline non-lysosomal ceramidase N-terminal domain-containing protein [Armatimonadota bacterium]